MDLTGRINAGLEKGTIQHVPSTQDLLASQGFDTANLRRRATEIAASITAKSDGYEAIDSPRSERSSSGITDFRFDHDAGRLGFDS